MEPIIKFKMNAEKESFFIRSTKLKELRKNRLIAIYLFLACLTLVSHKTTTAQVSFSTTYKEYCDWDNVKEEWSSNCIGSVESSLFVWNKDETLFKHTTETITSTYFVQSNEYDAVNNVYTYSVISDVGNKYYFVFDIKNLEIRAMPLNDDAEMVLIRWRVKAMF
jgi:hypothetical protein